MFVLFSPSESKRSGGVGAFKDSSNTLIANDETRLVLDHAYEKALTGSFEEKQSLTGWKDESKINVLPKILSEAPVMPALRRYNGVGYQYLDIDSLVPAQYDYLAKHVLIFSNLFGPLRGGDLIPETKLKQRAKFVGVNIAHHYREHTTKALDELIGDELVLDLRAEIYKKFYTPKGPVIECVFLKDGKRMNHWSKAYRGLVLRAVAKERPANIEDFLQMDVDGLKLIERKGTDHRTVVTYDTVS
jgi:uncharacterized protein